MTVADASLLDLASRLVAISSPSGEEHTVQRFIAEWFTRMGLAPRTEPAEDGLVNVVVEVEGAGTGPTVLIGGHCDTVAAVPGWTSDPLTPTVRDGRLYGLGAADMKGGLAAAMLATVDAFANRAAWNGRLIFVSLADEEAYSRGARSYLRNAPPIDMAVMVEPHFDDLVTGAIGKFNLAISAKGRSAHGSRPGEGVNAVTELSRLVVALGSLQRKIHPEHGTPTHCVLRMSGGMERYEIRVPDQATALVNWHVMPGETSEQARAIILDLIQSLHSPAAFEVEAREPVYGSYAVEAAHPLAAAICDLVAASGLPPPVPSFGSGVSDANIFNARGIPTVLFGPRGANLHAADEWVEIATLGPVRRTLAALPVAISEGLPIANRSRSDRHARG